ncbi:hydrogenase maturation protease [Rhabdothermincola sp.]|uniref:hydrogenase maturation protease n=1 Tax=Rhabdothermincola sp. TaxID=2820405 RepID=UPI002FE38A3B
MISDPAAVTPRGGREQPARSVVVGVGNPWRRDDGVGHRVVEAARKRLPPDVAVVLVDGEPTRLLEAWDGVDLAVVVDGIRTGGRAGAVRCVDLLAGPLVTVPAVSSHSGGIAEAVELGRVLGRLPARLVLIGVEITDEADGPGLSPAVVAAVGPAARRVAEVVSSAGGEG